MLAPSDCELSADVRIFGASVLKVPDTDTLRYIGSLRWKDKQAAPVPVPLCKECNVQMRLSNNFSGDLLLASIYLQTFAFSEHG